MICTRIQRILQDLSEASKEACPPISAPAAKGSLRPLWIYSNRIENKIKQLRIDCNHAAVPWPWLPTRLTDGCKDNVVTRWDVGRWRARGRREPRAALRPSTGAASTTRKRWRQSPTSAPVTLRYPQIPGPGSVTARAFFHINRSIDHRTCTDRAAIAADEGDVGSSQRPRVCAQTEPWRTPPPPPPPRRCRRTSA